jgi:hypothetical protein
VLEQERWAAVSHDAVGDLGDFEDRAQLVRDALELPGPLQMCDEVV